MDMSFPLTLATLAVFVSWLVCEIRKGPLYLRLLLPIPLMAACSLVSCALAGIGNFSKNLEERTAIKNLIDAMVDELGHDQPNPELREALSELNDNLVITYDGPSKYETQVQLFLRRLDRNYVSIDVFEKRQRQ